MAHDVPWGAEIQQMGQGGDSSHPVQCQHREKVSSFWCCWLEVGMKQPRGASVHTNAMLGDSVP